jgi:molybdopterin-guanine dinucleotide biosynthesis protein A
LAVDRLTVSHNDVTGVVLAGGRSLRMNGADKGLVQFNGRPLVARVLERLRPQVADMLISANRNSDAYARFAPRVVGDPAQLQDVFAGPLAGMLAALRVAPTPWIATVPCDAPFLPLDLVATLAARIGSSGSSGGSAPPGAAKAAVARCEGKLQPVFCLLHTDLAPPLEQALRLGQYKAAAWLARIGAVAVDFADADAFVNFNTPDDLDRAGSDR